MPTGLAVLALLLATLTGCGKRRAAAKDAAAAPPPPVDASTLDASLADELERVERAFPPGARFGAPADLHGLRRDADGVIHFPHLPRFAVFQVLDDAWGPNLGETLIPDVLHQTRWASPDGRECALLEEDTLVFDDDAPRWANVRFVPCASLPPEHRPRRE